MPHPVLGLLRKTVNFSLRHGDVAGEQGEQGEQEVYQRVGTMMVHSYMIYNTDHYDLVITDDITIGIFVD